LAPGHTGEGRPTANWDLTVLAGVGAIRSTVNDLLRFADANLSPPKDELGEAIELT
jgi:D-alanyl-D-alanine-carboxypeptidase/D-alanyl-D-alanine-endopeptidase